MQIGDRVRAHDDDYDEDYEGVVQDVRETRLGREAFVANELPGVFEGAIVALPVDQWEPA